MSIPEMTFTLHQHSRLSVAPMMGYTDRHCRYLHRQISRHALLYTEMIHVNAITHGHPARFLSIDPDEHPVALQLGGCDPRSMRSAAAAAATEGVDGVNLDVGCPSPRVKKGSFGAVLMARPQIVADCVEALQDGAPELEATVKCRIGIDDHDPEEQLPRFLEVMAERGVRRVIIHARKALLNGLSPKQNRTVPPLNYPLVHRMKQSFPELSLCLNGGIVSLEQALGEIEDGLDGVMIGRMAYRDPMAILGTADRDVFGRGQSACPDAVVASMADYIDRAMHQGVRPCQITRHMLGLPAGQPGAGIWRAALSDQEAVNDGGSAYLLKTYADVRELRESHTSA
ncbi:MAG: tRNA dihydrouridine(20/20a) synthase DusA [Rhodobacteraceae bacterium]|nr:tRNA dihydrouridine(20/20a) synthase DusA [Paracoccaceae bacterium]